MGMAYVCFTTREAADYAVEYFSTTKINNQYIIVKKWKPRSEVI